MSSASAFPGDKRRFVIEGLELACVEAGSGRPILFLHGNPVSSYLWRNILPPLAVHGRCLAPDLPGMGDSDPIPASAGAERYRFREHYRYLSALIDRLVPDEALTLVLHDWGSALGFHWAAEHPERIRGIAYMEALVRPLTWDEWPAASRSIFQALRSPIGEDLILNRNIFIERILPGSVQRPLTDEEMSEYRRPFAQGGESRRPMLAWPRELPIDGEPADVVDLVHRYSGWLARSAVPKLFINADPGAILVGAQREFCRRWPNQTEITVPGIHFVQEDSAAPIAAALAAWIACLPANR